MYLWGLTLEFQGFHFFSPKIDHLIDHLRVGKTVDEAFHTLGAVLAHLGGNIAVHIQGKGGGGMTKIPLDGINIVPVFYRRPLFQWTGGCKFI